MNDLKQSLTRRGFLGKAGAAGLGLAGVGLLAGHAQAAHGPGLDGQIVKGATIAEALATTMYYNIIANPNGIYQQGLAQSMNTNDQAYLVAGLQQEADHYAFLVHAGGPNLAGTNFYFPKGMFVDPQTTVNILTTLEDAFISAYIIGVRDFSSAGLRVLASRILGVECEHRAFARVITADLMLTEAQGLGGMEDVNGPAHAANNLAYERMFLNQISDAFTALTPFLTDPNSPGASTGFSPTPYPLPSVTISASGAGTLALPAGVTSVMLANDTP